MSLTDYHSKYLAHELTRRRPSDSDDKFAAAQMDAQVEPIPHQVDAALFAFRSPLSRGAILADEVGLGKTIEAGLVLSQRWAERRRRILVITPSNLRKQWYQELTDKFFLPCRLLESKSYNAATRQGQARPFEAACIIICSYQFARAKATEVQTVPWDLVVIVEALYWQHGRSTERDFLYVTTAHLGHEQLQQLSEEVGPDRSLLVLCTAFRGRDDYPNLTVKKIPKQILARCEWGHDDYSLQVENLPRAKPPATQQGLFEEEPK